ncbi:hypothetical protein ACFC09_25890 [Streptomyces sp. NPDC056161]|uniref:hypothetical protein n=1 Tax=Streptomyces sp. NPDC056161 TaxID=3345732 RepID=UPI0035D6BA8C
MGIRMLHRRTAQARIMARADAAVAPSPQSPPVPALAADASTARIPTAPATTVRNAVSDLGRRLGGHASRPDPARRWRHWNELARSYLALLLTLLPRPRPRPSRTITVFVATLTERPSGSAAHRPHRDRPEPGPDATL